MPEAAAEERPLAFELDGLRKRFGETLAVDGADLAVPEGSFFGLVGPNGAGKTTSLAMGVGLLRPDAGTALVRGVDVWAEPYAAKALIGVLPDGLAMPERLTGRELLVYLGRLRGLDDEVVAERTEDLLDVLDLATAQSTLIIEYSAGMRKKIGLAAAMLHAPRLLVLDEPFEAVDPMSALAIRAILDGFVETGGSVVISSHVMALVEQLSDHVGIMVDGRVVAAGPVTEVRGDATLEERFIDLVGGRVGTVDGLAWLTV